MIGIRWHSRAGQGAVTGAKVLCDILSREGKEVQAFSVYGAEKRGAPMNAFNRISDKPIIDHSKEVTPDFVLVIDPSLVHTDIAKGTKETTKFIITTHLSKDELVQAVPNLKGKDLFVVDCIGISQATIGKPIPNTPMLGAYVKVSQSLDIDKFIDVISGLLYKFPQEIIDGNIAAVRRAYNEVN